MKKLHNGCYINTSEIIALWSEKYSDPKFDSDCYLARALFKGCSTILTLGNFDDKEGADRFIGDIYNERNSRNLEGSL